MSNSSSVPDYVRRLVAEGEGVLSALLPELLVYLIDAIDEQTEQLEKLTAAVRELRQSRGR
jgi:hypothetical protein